MIVLSRSLESNESKKGEIQPRKIIHSYEGNTEKILV